MSDQTEKPKGALPKGYDANTPSAENTSSTEVVKQKKFNFKKLFTVTPTDQDQRDKDLQEYESSYLARIEKEAGPKPEESSDSFLVDLEVSTEPVEDLGKLNLRKHTTKQKQLQAERKEYEQKFLSRYKQPKSKSTKSSSVKHDTNTGKLTLKQYINAKRKAKQEEIKAYERKFLARYKQPKSKLKKKASSSSLYKPETPKPKRDMKKERKNYEQKYLARYKQPKTKPMKSSNLKYGDDLGRLNLGKHTVTKRKEYLANRKDYEAKYIQRYMNKQKSKSKRSSSKKLDHDLVSGRLNLREYVDKKRKELHMERNVYEKQYLARYKQAKENAKKSGSSSESQDDLGRLNLRKHAVTKQKQLKAERAEYEQKYLARYNKQQKSKPRSKTDNSSLYKPETPKPKRDMDKERAEYEKKYLTRYQKQQKTKRKKKK